MSGFPIHVSYFLKRFSARGVADGDCTHHADQADHAAHGARRCPRDAFPSRRSVMSTASSGWRNCRCSENTRGCSDRTSRAGDYTAIKSAPVEKSSADRCTHSDSRREKMLCFLPAFLTCNPGATGTGRTASINGTGRTISSLHATDVNAVCFLLFPKCLLKADNAT